MDSLQPDDIIQGRYRIVRKIGQGGFGAVYEAIDLRLNNRVALKHLLLGGDEVARAFGREARLLATLRHPALPRVSDFFTDDRGLFLVMDYIEGDDLAVALAQQGAPFLLDTVLDWADQLLGVLTYLHTRTPPILHRDIKPQNLKVVPPNEVVLLDFGLAKGLAAGGDGTSILHSIRAYTPGFAPLEQIDGSGTDARSDLYALAATLYHLLTNIVPADAVSRATAIPRRQPDPLRPLHEVNPAVPLAISEVLMDALALHADERPPSAKAMWSALRLARIEAATPSPANVVIPLPLEPPTVLDSMAPTSQIPDPVQRPWNVPRTKLIALVGGFLVVVLILAMFAFRPQEPNGDPNVVAGGGSATVQPTLTSTAPSAMVEQATLTFAVQPTATDLLTALEQPTATIEALAMLESITTATEQPTTTPEPTATATEQPTTTPEPTATAEPTSVPISRIAFTSDRDGVSEIYAMNADGTEQTRLTSNNTNDFRASWSPDGRKLAFTSDRDGNREIYVMNADGTNQIRLTFNQSDDYDASWSPSGQQLVFHSYRDGNFEVYVMNTDGSNQTRLTFNEVYDGVASWSPDGQQIVFTSERNKNVDIYLMNSDGNNQNRLNSNVTDEYDASWSPDGQQVMFTSGRSGSTDIYVVNVDGSNQTRLTFDQAGNYGASWSPDGQQIVFTSDRSGSKEIYKINANGTNQIRLTSNETSDYLPSWSPVEQ